MTAASAVSKAKPGHRLGPKPKFEAVLKLNTGSHTGCIRQMLPTPDGLSLITGGECTLRVWDLATKKCTGMLLGQVEGRSAEIFGNGNVSRFALDASGRFVVVLKLWWPPPFASEDVGCTTEVQVFDVASGHLRSAWRSPDRLEDLAFSPDGQSLVMVGTRWQKDGQVRAWLWAYETKTVLGTGFGRRWPAVAKLPLEDMQVLWHQGLWAQLCFVPDDVAASSVASRKPSLENKATLVVALQKEMPVLLKKGVLYQSQTEPGAPRGELRWFALTRGGRTAWRMRESHRAKLPSAVEVSALTVSHSLALVGALASRRGQKRAPQVYALDHEGKLVERLATDTSPMRLAFSADGRRLLVGLRRVDTEATAEAQRWGNLEPGASSVKVDAYDVLGHRFSLRSSYFGHDDSLDAVVWLKDGSVASAGGDNHSVHLWRSEHRVGQAQGQLKGVGRSLFQPTINEQEEVCFGVVPPRWLPAGHPPQQLRFSLREMRLINSCPGPAESGSSFTEKWGISNAGGQVIPIGYAPRANEARPPDLSLFVGDDDEWVIWTPSGYYNASPGGDKHFGYHLNRGADQEALFFPADRFSKLFFRPHIVNAVAWFGTEEAARDAGVVIEAVDVTAHLPPIIEIAPQGLRVEGDELHLRFSVQRLHGGQALKRVWILRDGVFVWGEGSGRKHYRPSLRLQPGPNRITVHAETEKTKAVPVELLLQGPSEETVAKAAVKGSGAGVGAALQQKPGKLFLLAVGVSDFAVAGTEAALGYKRLIHAHDDAVAIHNGFAASRPEMREHPSARRLNKAFESVRAQVLVNEQATKQRILSELKLLCDEIETRHRANVSRRDVLLVFLSGHGVRYTGESDLYFWNHDLRPRQMDVTGLSMLHLGELVTSTPAEVVLVIDACHAGMAGSNVVGGFNAEELAKRLYAVNERGMYVLSASRGEEEAQENERAGLSVFTSAIMAALQRPRYFSSAPGQSNAKGSASLSMMSLMAAVQELVPHFSEQAKRPMQTPVCRMYGSLLPLDIYRR